MDVVRIFDTTLRDGEQSPGFSMNTTEKIRLARQLAALNVDVIERAFDCVARRPRSGQESRPRSPHRAHCSTRSPKKQDVDAAIEA